MSIAAARQQIHDALLSYCRGIDRLDAEAVSAAFHPGAWLSDYGADSMSIEDFVPYALASLEKRFRATQHRISNTTIEFDDDGGALVETYVLAFHVQARDSGEVLQTFNGRYIDRFEERGGWWKIVSRTLRSDWSTVEPMGAPMPGAWKMSGRGGTPDPIWPDHQAQEVD